MLQTLGVLGLKPTQGQGGGGEDGDDAPYVEDPEGLEDWNRAYGAIAGDLKRALSSPRGDPSRIRMLDVLAVEKAGAGDYDGAHALLEKLKVAIADALTSTRDQLDGVPKEVEPYVRARLAWTLARSKLRVEIGRLESAIVRECAGVEGLEDVVANAGVLRDYIDLFDHRLEDVLLDLTRPLEPPARERLRAEAQVVVADYRDTLAEDFFQDVDSNNGFVQVAVAQTARSVLDMVAKVVA